MNNIGAYYKSVKLAYDADVESLKSSVSNGKNLIANAITGKGVATSSSDTFATMAGNIGNIMVGIQVSKLKCLDDPIIVASSTVGRPTGYDGQTSTGLCDYGNVTVTLVNKSSRIWHYNIDLSTSSKNVVILPYGICYSGQNYAGIVFVKENLVFDCRAGSISSPTSLSLGDYSYDLTTKHLTITYDGSSYSYLRALYLE